MKIDAKVVFRVLLSPVWVPIALIAAFVRYLPITLVWLATADTWQEASRFWEGGE